MDINFSVFKYRMEFAMDGTAFGLLAVGDIGKLKFQGTRYLGYQRLMDKRSL